ncbi:MAG: cytidine deaminase [Rikenellaceae bacterium]
MKSSLTIEYQKYSSMEQLREQDRELLLLARARAASAYAPYSKFRVGAALRLEGGEMISAANIESEVFPAGVCAERALLNFVRSDHPNVRIEAMAITSISTLEECYPCGMCRQAILDAERVQGSKINIIMGGASSATIVDSAELLLPFTFKL